MTYSKYSFLPIKIYSLSSETFLSDCIWSDPCRRKTQTSGSKWVVDWLSARNNFKDRGIFQKIVGAPPCKKGWQLFLRGAGQILKFVSTIQWAVPGVEPPSPAR